MIKILASSFILKSLGSGIAVLMFLAIARTMDVEEFGNFSAGFASAQGLAAFGCFGIRIAILRDTSAALGKGDDAKARTIANRLTGLAIIGVILTLFLPAIGIAAGQSLAYCLSIGALAAVLNWSEHASSLIRAHGGVALALSPKEVFWRILVTASALIIIGNSAFENSAEFWLMTMTAWLVLVQGVQWLLFAERPSCMRAGSTSSVNELLAFLRTHWDLWLVVVLGVVESQASVVLVRAILDAESTALLFVAMKIAAVVALPVVAIGPVIAPQISGAYARNAMEEVQQIGSLTALATSLGAAFGLLVIIVFGDRILAYFGGEYVSAQPVVLTLAAAQLIGAFFGPTGFAMLMMEHQRAALVVLLISVIVSMSLTVILAISFGTIGAAIGIGSLIVINKSSCYIYLRLKHRVHLSLLGLLACNNKAIGDD